MRRLLKRVSAVVLVAAVIAGAGFYTKSNSVKADTAVLTSPNITVTGYQMKTDVSADQGISFRAICKAPQKGSTLTVSGSKYTVTDLGIIYTKDPNTTGYHSSNILDKSYTELNPLQYPKSDIRNLYGFKYIGQKEYQSEVVTYGYLATDVGITKTESGYTTYTRTLTNMDPYVRNTLFVRAYVEATDSAGNTTLIYGEKASLTSVASVAYKVYTGGLASDEAGHKYLYDSILHKLPETSPYYLNQTEEYGWGGVVNP